MPPQMGLRSYAHDHRGRYRDGQWVFGGVEQESRNCFLVAVSNRKTDTLFPPIQE